MNHCHTNEDRDKLDAQLWARADGANDMDKLLANIGIEGE